MFRHCLPHRYVGQGADHTLALDQRPCARTSRHTRVNSSISLRTSILRPSCVRVPTKS